MEWFAANGVTTLYELGAGKVLTGLARRIDKNINGVSVNGPADIDAAIAALTA
ncbi:Malonyl CoA-acyl carrier protein transacylase [compost metagenome]